MDINPLLQEWTTPYQTPPFHLFRNEHYAPAVREAIKTAEIWYMLACQLRIELNTAFSTIQPTEAVMCNFVYPHYKVLPDK